MPELSLPSSAFGHEPASGVPCRFLALAFARVGVVGPMRQDRSKARPDEVVQTPVARLSGRAASRATNAYAVRAAEIVLTH